MLSHLSLPSLLVYLAFFLGSSRYFKILNKYEPVTVLATITNMQIVRVFVFVIASPFISSPCCPYSLQTHCVLCASPWNLHTWQHRWYAFLFALFLFIPNNWVHMRGSVWTPLLPGGWLPAWYSHHLSSNFFVIKSAYRWIDPTWSSSKLLSLSGSNGYAGSWVSPFGLIPLVKNINYCHSCKNDQPEPATLCWSL